jgi:hypothetical protein
LALRGVQRVREGIDIMSDPKQAEPVTARRVTFDSLNERIEALASGLAKLHEKADGHRQWLENLGTSVANMLDAQTPGPYTELAAEVNRLRESHEIARRVQASLETLIDRQTTPQLTVRQWREDDGTWHYETIVSLKPETAEALPATLRWVDDMARAEAKRREAADRTEQGSKALGSNQRHG